jgi:hypothetical protein
MVTQVARFLSDRMKVSLIFFSYETHIDSI